MPGKVLHYAVDGDGRVVDYDTMCGEWASWTACVSARRGRFVAVSRMIRAEGADACPFCGSEEVYVEEYEHHPRAVRWRVLCAGCMAGIDTGTRQSAGEAVLDWNRRAGRTCRPEVCDDGAGAWGVYCSECGYRFAGPHGKREVSEHMATRRDIMPRYCLSCGARVEVVDE